MSRIPPHTVVPLTDQRIPAWVLTMARKYEGVCAVAHLPPPDDGEWWLLGADGDLIEAIWLER